MGKALGVALATVIMFLVWQRRQVVARGRLREIDEGRRCIACDRTSMQLEGDRARCLSCGYTAHLSKLQATVISAREIADVTKPPQQRL
jgi:hypothetical protein